MKNVKKGDIVGRISYGKDILFIIERIIKTTTNQNIAILKGLTIRIQADSPLEDLELIEIDEINRETRKFEEELEKRIQKNKKILQDADNFFREKIYTYTGKILHIDGDKKYSQKSVKYYRRMGLNAIVRNIPERKQPQNVKQLINRYQPDIIVITGHDGMLKKGTRFNDIYNYRNSRYFIQAVKMARECEKAKKDLVIFARSLSKLL